MELSDFVRDVQDFPSAGILFKDISPLLGDPEAMAMAVGTMAEPFRDLDIAAVAGVEARGFLFGPFIAQRLDVGFVPIRKPGKLPPPTSQLEYSLEYGTDRLEVRHDAFAAGSSVLLVDDVLATGGTLQAARNLVEQTGASVVGVSVLIELVALGGRAKLTGLPFSASIEVH